MKKKLNLLWNLKFNFFSVAERPLTFFAYFLNAKKVGRRRLVIGPAKAGAFLFSHTRLPFPPRPLLPFGRISPAAKPRVRSSAPPFGFAAQNRARHFAARDPPVRPSASRPRLRRPAPLFCCCRFLQFSRSYARLLVFNSVFAAQKPAQPVTGPTGAAILPSPSRLRRARPPTAKPRPSSFSIRFFLRKNRRAHPPAFGRRGVDKVRKYHFVCVVLSSAPLTLSPLYAPARPVFRNRPKEKAAAENRCGCEHAIYEL